MPKVNVYYKIPISYDVKSRPAYNQIVVYSDKDYLFPIGFMIHQYNYYDNSEYMPISEYSTMYPVSKLVYIQPSLDAPKRIFKIQYIANTIEPITAKIMDTVNMPYLTNVVRVVDTTKDNISYGHLELTINTI